jgi:hypothetical protein
MKFNLQVIDSMFIDETHRFFSGERKKKKNRPMDRFFR